MIDSVQIVCLMLFFLAVDTACIPLFAVSGGRGPIGTLARLIWPVASVGILVSAICLFIALRIQPCR